MCLALDLSGHVARIYEKCGHLCDLKCHCALWYRFSPEISQIDNTLKSLFLYLTGNHAILDSRPPLAPQAPQITSGYLPTMGPCSLARVAEGLLLRSLVSDPTRSSRGLCGAGEGKKGMATLTSLPRRDGKLRPGRRLLPSAWEVVVLGLVLGDQTGERGSFPT